MNYYANARHADFVKRAKQILRKAIDDGVTLTFDELIDITLATRPVSFHQSYERAISVMNDFEAKTAGMRNKNNLLYWTDMRQQVINTMAMRKRLRFSQAVQHVVTFCRPMRFYIAHDTARRILKPHFTTAVMHKAV